MIDHLGLGSAILLAIPTTIAILSYLFLFPPTHPKGIPAVPFWVTLIPFFRDVDQSETFRKYIETPLREHGAVKLFFGARWNVIVHRPKYLAEMFRREDVFQKSGNHKKIAHSVLAEFLGENIISAHGETWKGFREVIKPGLQRQFEVEPVARNAVKLCGLIENASGPGVDGNGGGGVAVQELLQRYTIANIAQSILQTDFGTLDDPKAKIHQLQTSLKQQIFKPIFMSFPFLDRLPIPSRTAARVNIAHFKDELVSNLVSSHSKQDINSPEVADKLGARLLAARNDGRLTEQQFRNNLTVLYVAGQENPQLGLISTLFLLAEHQDVQDRLADDIIASGETEPNHEALASLPYLTAVVYESLRCLPPISQLVNRRAAVDASLGEGLYIPKGTYLGYQCYSTHRDERSWGRDASEFRPGRWGSTGEEIQKYLRSKKAKAEFVSFHGGNRACLGERFAVLELKVTLWVLLSRFRWRLDPAWPRRMTPAGPLFPRGLRLVFERREAAAEK